MFLDQPLSGGKGVHNYPQLRGAKLFLQDTCARELRLALHGTGLRQTQTQRVRQRFQCAERSMQFVVVFYLRGFIPAIELSEGRHRALQAQALLHRQGVTDRHRRQKLRAHHGRQKNVQSERRSKARIGDLRWSGVQWGVSGGVVVCGAKNGILTAEKHVAPGTSML